MKVFVLLLTFTVNPVITTSINGFVAGGGSSQVIEFSTREECESGLSKITSYYSQQKNIVLADGVCIEKSLPETHKQSTENAN